MYKKCDICGATLDPGERCDCAKVDVGFCQASYREAKDKEKQIKILAELYAVGKETIIAVLGDRYQAPGKKPPAKGEYRKEKAIMKSRLIAYINCGLSVAEAAERVGVSYSVAATHTKEARAALRKTKVKSYDPLSDLA